MATRAAEPHLVHVVFLLFRSGLHCRGLGLQTEGAMSKDYQTHIAAVQ